VSIPVKLYSAVQSSALDLDMLDSRDHARIRYQRVNEHTHKEVPYNKIVKGYKLNDDGECGKVSTVEPTVLCPDGSTAEDKKCATVLAAPSVLYCSKGELMNGRCVEVKESKQILTCSNGSKLKNGICVLVEKMDPSEL